MADVCCALNMERVMCDGDETDPRGLSWKRTVCTHFTLYLRALKPKRNARLKREKSKKYSARYRYVIDNYTNLPPG